MRQKVAEDRLASSPKLRQQWRSLGQVLWAFWHLHAHPTSRCGCSRCHPPPVRTAVLQRGWGIIGLSTTSATNTTTRPSSPWHDTCRGAIVTILIVSTHMVMMNTNTWGIAEFCIPTPILGARRASRKKGRVATA
jgi:hypothetical protein